MTESAQTSLSHSQHHGKGSTSAVMTDIIYGCINAIMVIPISISFCTIIFRDAAFINYMPYLVKLVLFSSAIHQICFAIFSSLPFAIGQVQDAGLIFLSAMAASIAQGISSNSPDDPSIMPTTLFTLGICTALLGGMLMVVARLRLASMVQYLPMPVVGGYLAFIGFFCGLAGLSLMAGVQVTSVADFPLFFNEKCVILLAPGVTIGVATYFLLGYFRSPFVLPASLLFVLTSFYGFMFLTGTSFEEVREYGWVAPLIEVGSPFEAWSYYDVTKVQWQYLPAQFLTLVAMFLVVAFSSSLDVAAIEMELGAPLDYNRELNTVGISNLVSGLFGGYTGSYIFSQTIFSMRRGVSSTICGFIVAAGELIFVLLPISITSYVPKMFFGSLLVLIATDLMVEWLVIARHKMMMSEYAVCLFTFAAIQWQGIELGMFLGILAATLSFVVTYSKLQSVSEVTLRSSTVIRAFEERSLLIASRGKIVTISFGGYIFFGSSVQVLEQIKSKLVLSSELPPPPPPSSPTDPLSHSSDPAPHQQPIPKPCPPSTPYKELNVANKANYAILMKTPKTSKKKSATPPPTGKKKSPFSSSKSDDVEAGLNERTALLPKIIEGTGYGAVGGQDASDDEQNDSRLRLVYKPTSPKPQKKSVTSSTSSNTSSPPHHHHLKTAYDLTPQQLQHQYKHWHEEEVKHEEAQRNHHTQPTHSLPPSQPLPTTQPLPSKPSDDNWAVGEDLEQQGNQPEVDLAQARASPRIVDVPPTGAGAKTNTLTPSTSLLDLVWKNQAVKREKKLRSMSDLSDDAALVAAAVKASPSRHVTRANSAGTSILAPGLPPIPATPLSGTSSPQISAVDLSRPNKPTLTLPPPLPSLPALPFTSSTVPLLSKLSHQPVDSSTSTEEVTTEYLVLDFSEVKGVDATAARSCFLTLVHLMRNASVKIVFASLSREMEELLRSHRVLEDDSILIPDIDDALEWCEDQVIASLADKRRATTTSITTSSKQKQLRDYVNASRQRQLQSQLKTPRHSISIAPSTSTDNASVEEVRSADAHDLFNLPNLNLSLTRPLRSIIEDYLEIDTSSFFTSPPVSPGGAAISGLGPDVASDASLQQISSLLASSVLSQYFSQERFPPYHLIYDIDDAAEKVYFIESGHVELVTMSLMQLEQSRWQQQQATSAPPNASEHEKVRRVNKVCAGGIVGEADFFLARNHR